MKIREMQEISFIYAEIKTTSSCKIKNAKNCNLSIYSFSHFFYAFFIIFCFCPVFPFENFDYFKLLLNGTARRINLTFVIRTVICAV